MWQFDCRQWETMNHSHSVDASITHSLTVIKRSIIVVQMYICIIDNQYVLSAYYYLHPETFAALTIWFTTAWVIWAINDVAILRSSAFGRQFAARRSSPKFLINICLSVPPFLIQLLLLDFHDRPETLFKFPTIWTRAKRRVMYLNAWRNAAWRLSCIQVHIALWPLLQWLIWHHSLKSCW